MVAEIVSVGTELLLGQIADTDAPVLGRVFAELGIDHFRRQTIGDNLDRLREALEAALTRSDIVVTIGGLGPTQDDLTRDAIAAVMTEPLEQDEVAAAHLRNLFATRKHQWVDSQLRQAMKPSTAKFIENTIGTAPGLHCKVGSKTLLAMPGPPREFVPMAEGPVRKILANLSPEGVLHSRVLRVCGMGEGAVEDRIRPWLSSSNPTVAPYAKPAEVHLRITARAKTIDEADRLIDPLEFEIRKLLGDAIYATGETSLEAATLDILENKGWTVSVAESCSGGILGSRFTSVPGASRTFLGGAICYSNALKESMVGVLPPTLQTFGAVSRECCHELAEGALRRFGSTFGLAITGVAGPDGGSPEKPVGLVFIGLAGPSGTEVREERLHGSRDDVRFRSTQSALLLLRRELLRSH